MQRLIVFIGIISVTFSGLSQHTTSHLQGIDVLRYLHRFTLNDSTNILTGETSITLNLKNQKSFFLDFENLSQDGKGMKVESVEITKGDNYAKDEYSYEVVLKSPCEFQQKEKQLFIQPKISELKDSIITIEINYEGVPRDGLVIGKNMYDSRTFFGDNWPNRAHQWFPCIDHPSDKAKVEYFITGPNHYEFIANGRWKDYSISDDGSIKTVHYKSEKELPTKIMVIGVADLKTDTVHSHHQFPVTSLVYPENEKEGFFDFSQADSILDFFIEKIGTYPFEKLANVQSTTRFGGMENASCIFYDEHSITGTRSNENLMAHEIAHQWFGNSASEKDWRHLWLSEGFATYLTICYVEEKYGKEKMNQMLQKDREKVIRFHQINPRPVVDTTSNYLSLLNPNSYEKGSWFLHMLRNKVGDKLFWEGVKKYYETYQFSNANTDDFLKIMEEESNLNLKHFFNFWLLQPEHLKLKVQVFNYPQSPEISFLIYQNQQVIYEDEIEIQINFEDNSSTTLAIQLKNKTEEFKHRIERKAGKIESIVIDPENKLLQKTKLVISKLN